MGPRGSYLSAGQRQRIGLARAFFGDRKLIVLDEPNANLDPEGEEALASAIEAACARGAIVVVVTHRLNLLRRVSHAALLQDGRIARFGEARQIIEAATQPLSRHQAIRGKIPKSPPWRRAVRPARGMTPTAPPQKEPRHDPHRQPCSRAELRA